jgi:hypothetical protein
MYSISLLEFEYILFRETFKKGFLKKQCGN